MAADPLDFLGDSQPLQSETDPLNFLQKKKLHGFTEGGEKKARKVVQYALGQADRAVLPLTMQSQVLESEGAQQAEYRKHVFEDIERLAEQKATGIWDEQDEQLLQSQLQQIKHPELAKKNVKTANIRPSNLIRKGIKKVTGYDLEPEGFGEHAAEFLGSFTPKEIYSGTKKIIELPKKLKETATRETLPSGLSKPRAVESKIAPLTSIGKETQKKAIEKLNTEAGHLAKAKVHEHLPVSKQIEEGVDFKGFFNKGFENLEKTAQRNKVIIDIDPVSNLMNKTIQKYKGVPSLHKDALKIKKEIRLFNKKPPTTVAKLLKTYRSNNAKLESIYETSRLKGSQKEYADFLIDQNKAIAESFRGTLGKDNSWVKEFDRLNAGFKQWQNGQKTLRELDSFFGGRLTPRSLEKLGNDPRTQQKLALSMGEEGAKEIGQIARDLKLAIDSIKNISTTKLHKYEAVLPLSYFIPVIGKITGTAGSIIVARNLLGTLMSKPKYRRAYSDALKSLINDDIESYRAATSAILKIMKNPEEE